MKERPVPSSAQPPFKAEVVGSLLRPAAIFEARDARAQGRASAEELWAVETKAVEDAVALQRSVGLKVCTDGEFRRRHWFMDFIERIDGVGFEGSLPTRFHNEGGDIEFAPPRVVVNGKLRRSQPLSVHHFEGLKPIAERAGLVPKQPIPSPTLLHFRGGRAGIDSTAYPDLKEFFADLAKVYREEIAALYAAGCRYVQIDETNLPFLCDPKMREGAKARGEDPEALPRTYVALLNDCLRDVPDDMTVGIHMCRGNHESAWAAEGAYDPVAELAFGGIDVDALFLEYDSPRAGSFAPLKYLGKGKTAVLGLVTTKKGALETKDELKRRIDEAARATPLSQLALSPQCGFASTIRGNALTPDEQKRKLELVVEVARDVWG
ncbi:MAG: 5-methyltetrahydropteroyltriglutamate--homocysteine S-methyltransferase [Alphaproteobacteria bacterium]|nr:5-methyltetrahydropteroyltriglutamate--homocysteine S-methyltransferase [Alphaproteobacteria bacterium]